MDTLEKGNRKINEFSDQKSLFVELAKDFIHRAKKAVESKGEFMVVLSGGNTPKLFFDVLINQNSQFEKIPWQQIKFFFCDERYVPLDNKESNYHMAYEHLFSKVPILPGNIYRIPTEYSDSKDAAQKYERTLRTIFRLKNTEYPQFDVCYLGLGEDGHTASLMPLSHVVAEYSKGSSTIKKEFYQLVMQVSMPEQNLHRITLTPSAINHSNTIIFIAIGANKASAVFKVLEGSYEPGLYPAQLINPISGQTIWYLDSEAAGRLK